VSITQGGRLLYWGCFSPSALGVHSKEFAD
jgi:hypothetical protein